jgi:hypothetical protein
MIEIKNGNETERFTQKDLYWLKMEQDNYKNDAEKFHILQQIIDKIEENQNLENK